MKHRKKTYKQMYIGARNLQRYYGYFKQTLGYREVMKRLKDHISGKHVDKIAHACELFLFTQFKNINYSLGY